MDQTKPIIALDFSSRQEVDHLLEQFENQSLNLKVGMELYYTLGAQFVSELINYGHSIFLDLKLHDIPNTVERTMMGLCNLGVSMVNVHALGGRLMIEAAKRGLEKSSQKKKPLLLAVTQLTSTSEAAFQQEQLSSALLNESVVHLAKMAKEAGADGVVCSPREVEMIKQACGQDFVCVTPGIRLNPEIQSDDQVRITTAGQARQIGSDYIVVGRPITQANDIQQAYIDIETDWNGK